MRKKICTALIVAIMVLSLTACQGIPSLDDVADSLSLSPTSAESEGDSQTGNTDGELDEETEHLLYNTYIDINNAMLNQISDSLNHYFTYVDYESEEFRLLEGNDGYYSSLYLISEQHDVETAYEIVSGKSEKDALDQAFLNMYPSIHNLLQTLNEIGDYTYAESFRKDDYAKSQEHHTALISVLDEYYTTGEAFITELFVVAEQQRLEDLEQMKADGYVVLYSLNMMINYAQEIENELYDQGVWDDNILDMDLTAIQPLYDEFSAYVDAVLAYDEETLSAEGFNNNSPYWDMLIHDMENTSESITKVLAKVEAGEPLDPFDTMITSATGQCSLTSFTAGVSSMIDSYNRLISY